MRGSGAFEAVTVVDEFRPEARSGVLKERTVCVGLDEIKTSAAGTQYIGVSETDQSEVYGKAMEISAGYRIYVPAAEGGTACHAVFSQLADYLLLGNSTLRPASLRCGELGYHHGLNAYTLTATALFKTTAVGEYANGEELGLIIVTKASGG